MSAVMNVHHQPTATGYLHSLLCALVGLCFRHYLLASLLAAAAHLLNPSFFHEPFFFLYLGANFLNALPYLLLAADAFRGFFPEEIGAFS